MKPTTEQIAQAERLQAKGLCQGAKKYICKSEARPEGWITNNPQCHKKHCIGPSPDFKESIWEARKFLEGTMFAVIIQEDYIFIDSEGDTVWTSDKIILKRNLDDAAIEALLYLSEGE